MEKEKLELSASSSPKEARPVNIKVSENKGKIKKTKKKQKSSKNKPLTKIEDGKVKYLAKDGTSSDISSVSEIKVMSKAPNPKQSGLVSLSSSETASMSQGETLYGQHHPTPVASDYVTYIKNDKNIVEALPKQATNSGWKFPAIHSLQSEDVNELSFNQIKDTKNDHHSNSISLIRQQKLLIAGIGPSVAKIALSQQNQSKLDSVYNENFILKDPLLAFGHQRDYKHFAIAMDNDNVVSRNFLALRNQVLKKLLENQDKNMHTVSSAIADNPALLTSLLASSIELGNFTRLLLTSLQSALDKEFLFSKKFSFFSENFKTLQYMKAVETDQVSKNLNAIAQFLTHFPSSNDFQQFLDSSLTAKVVGGSLMDINTYVISDYYRVLLRTDDDQVGITDTNVQYPDVAPHKVNYFVGSPSMFVPTGTYVNHIFEKTDFMISFDYVTDDMMYIVKNSDSILSRLNAFWEKYARFLTLMKDWLQGTSVSYSIPEIRLKTYKAPEIQESFPEVGFPISRINANLEGSSRFSAGLPVTNRPDNSKMNIPLMNNNEFGPATLLISKVSDPFIQTYVLGFKAEGFGASITNRGNFVLLHGLISPFTRDEFLPPLFSRTANGSGFSHKTKGQLVTNAFHDKMQWVRSDFTKFSNSKFSLISKMNKRAENGKYLKFEEDEIYSSENLTDFVTNNDVAPILRNGTLLSTVGNNSLASQSIWVKFDFSKFKLAITLNNSSENTVLTEVSLSEIIK